MAVALVFKTNLQHHHLPKVPLQAESDFVFEAYIDPVRLPPLVTTGANSTEFTSRTILRRSPHIGWVLGRNLINERYVGSPSSLSYFA